MITMLDQLTPATRAVAQAWLDSSVAAAQTGAPEAVRAALTRALCEALDADTSPEEFADVIARIDIDAEDAEQGALAAPAEEAFVLAAGYPALVLAAVVAHYAVRGRALADPLPSAWGSDGCPVRWVSKGEAVLTDIGITLAASALATAAATSRRRLSGRVCAMAAASAVSTLVGTVTVLRPVRRTGRWVRPALAAGPVAAAVATLMLLSLAGRAAQPADS
ncbi:MAG: hypothetical protein QM708_07325 [Propioniciclava sp.]|uniref:hypothetical protein n=1 Tax=Propioniciclava sp. TaxID=2038686 RepID=UPI0039E2F228